jgi:pyridinium-3,5-bisthiocarboxylic acid mononucleotide nickel chelatase
MKIAYLDCFSGISGDMFVGSLIDAGLHIEKLQKILSGLSLDGYKIWATKEERNSIHGTKFNVSIQKNDNKSRHLEDITTLLYKSNLPSPIIEKSIHIFKRLAVVEGKIHNVSPHHIHFHEVGALDSIIDIVAAVAGVYLLNIEKMLASKIALGSGIIDSAHGKIPVPSPATMEFLKEIPIYQTNQNAELVTPTGAALITSLCSSFGPIPPMLIHSIGYGVGDRILDSRPNLLRILIGNDKGNEGLEIVLVLESNLDDISPELLGYLMEKLFDAGAIDVNYTHIQMKKNRPGIKIEVIARPEDKDLLTTIIFKESTALGIRFNYIERKILKRQTIVVTSPWGDIKVKKIIGEDKKPEFVPEYEECRKIARENGLALKEVYAWVSSLPYKERPED